MRPIVPENGHAKEYIASNSGRKLDSTAASLSPDQRRPCFADWQPRDSLCMRTLSAPYP